MPDAVRGDLLADIRQAFVVGKTASQLVQAPPRKERPHAVSTLAMILELGLGAAQDPIAHDPPESIAVRRSPHLCWHGEILNPTGREGESLSPFKEAGQAVVTPGPPRERERPA
jgi:hypothetical protein